MNETVGRRREGNKLINGGREEEGCEGGRNKKIKERSWRALRGRRASSRGGSFRLAEVATFIFAYLFVRVREKGQRGGGRRLLDERGRVHSG